MAAAPVRHGTPNVLSWRARVIFLEMTQKMSLLAGAQ